MDGIDALRKMQEGKVVAIVHRGFVRDKLYEFQYRYKDGILQMRQVRFDPLVKGAWKTSGDSANLFFGDLCWEERDVETEFDLTFKDAVKAIYEGKTVICECDPEWHYVLSEEGVPRIVKGNIPYETGFTDKVVRSRWKVVE